MDKQVIKFSFDVKALDKFRRNLTDLGKINKVIKLKFKEDKLLMYSMESSGTTALAFKSYTYLIKDFFDLQEDEFTKEDNYVDEFDDGMSDNKEVLEFDWIIGDVKVFCERLNFFGENEIKGLFNIVNRNEVNQVNKVQFSDGRFDFSLFSSENHAIRDVSIEQLNMLLDPEKHILKLTFPTTELNSAKKAARIDTDDVVCLEVLKSDIKIKQSSWKLKLGKIDSEVNKSKYSFHKKFLKSINPRHDEVNIWTFPTYIVFQEENEKFMISYEQDY